MIYYTSENQFLFSDGRLNPWFLRYSQNRGGGGGGGGPRRLAKRLESGRDDFTASDAKPN